MNGSRRNGLYGTIVHFSDLTASLQQMKFFHPSMRNNFYFKHLPFSLDLPGEQKKYNVLLWDFDIEINVVHRSVTGDVLV